MDTAHYNNLTHGDSTEVTYKGEWQLGSTIRQVLEGPVGPGEVAYPNGDRFKGFFHLSYASINGPAYAACGRYDFADGSWIDDAWINTSKDRKATWWGLHGIFRVHHPGGRDSIAMFCGGGRRNGIELVLPAPDSSAKPSLLEWQAGERVIRYDGNHRERDLEVTDYTLDETSREDCLTLTVTFRDGCTSYCVEQQGGNYETNKYDQSIYAPYTHVTLRLPNGDSIDHYGTALRDFKPWDGYVDVHCAATGMKRTELWKEGTLKEAGGWKYDYSAALTLSLPDPSGAAGELKAAVWKDGHIDYNLGEWTYDGETRDNRPQGQGILTGSRLHGDRRYEGVFRAGVFVPEEKPFAGEIRLHARSGHRHWSVSGDGEWEYTETDIIAALGSLDVSGFRSYEITAIRPDCVTLSHYKETWEVRPNQPLHLSEEIEGREWSDGCVYDGDDYSLTLTWLPA